MNTPDYVIDIQHLSKAFERRGVSGGYSTIKSAFLSLFGFRSPRIATTEVIKDLTLRIPKGLSVGVIGRNGSGKSTLLKLITGIYSPDLGSVEVTGRVAALIELGAGFHPDFTGRENLILGGIMHGLSKSEVRERFDDIVSFAELEGVIDEPVRTYSSGMFMRLGFSLAIHTDPDILLIDEVLAVGDAAFEAKCKDRISALRGSGKTLIMVSHDLAAIERWSDEVLWIDRGVVRTRGEPRRVIDEYRSAVEEEEEANFTPVVNVAEQQSAQQQEPKRWGSREIEIVSVQLNDHVGNQKRVVHPDDEVEFRLQYKVHQPREKVAFGVAICRADGLIAIATNTDLSRASLSPLGRSGEVRIRFKELRLLDGTYSLDVAVHAEDGYPFDYHRGAFTFAVRGGVPHAGIFLPEHSWDATGGQLPVSGVAEVGAGRAEEVA